MSDGKKRNRKSPAGKRQQKSRALVVTRPADGDASLVDAVIAHVSRLYHRGAITTMVEVGEYLIEELFTGDLALAASHHPSKPAAMAQLLARANETPLSAHALKKSVPIAVQYRDLPQHTADQLPQSHHELLLLVEDAGEKRRLAADAVERRLTVKQFEKEIRKVKTKHAGGRVPRPAVVRWAGSVRRATEAPLEAAALSAATLRGLSPEDALAVAQALKVAREHIERVGDALTLHRRVKK